MAIAQRLYENGFITYMRTDSTNLSSQAISAARNEIRQLYGDAVPPRASRVRIASKVKNAQEAHEAIRPVGRHGCGPLSERHRELTEPTSVGCTS